MKVFVTDGDQRPALAITRSLGRRDVSVLVGEEHEGSLASASKYCARHVTYPSPFTSPERFEQFLLSFVHRERIDVVMPVTDVTAYLVARIRPVLGCAAAAPPFEAFNAASDKSGLLDLARQCEIPVPRTHRITGLAMLNALAPPLEYPVVVRPARSRILTSIGWVGTTVHHVDDEVELRRLYRETEYLASHASLIQERIVGPGVGVFVLFDRGTLVASFAHRRLREKPPSGGVSVLCESIPLDRELLAQATRLLTSLQWHGVAMLEYKLDRRTGAPYLMEVNGRFWGSLQLAVDAGVDFPYLACQLALGHRPESPVNYAIGVKSRWLLGDLDHLLLRLRHSNRALRLPDDAPSRWRALADFVKGFAPGVRHDIARRDDPAPFVYELNRYLREAAPSAARSAARFFDRSRWRRAAPSQLSGESR